MDIVSSQDSPYKNTLLIAMPGVAGDAFAKSVVYICAHSDAGAMGIIVNQKMPDTDFSELLSQLSLPQSKLAIDPIVHFGGPVDTSRGFVLHTPEFLSEETVSINERFCMTGTIDILEDIAAGKGPVKSIFALGYAGWGPGQLEEEMQNNAWLVVPADEDLIFTHDLGSKWEKALSRLGIFDPALLSHEVGHG